VGVQLSARQRYTLTQMLQRLGNRLQNSPFWTQPEQTALINESLRTWSCLTGQWKQRVLLTTQPNLPYYSLAGSLTFGMHLEFGSTSLIQSSVINWDKGYPYWEGRPDPNGPQEWAPIGISLIAIRPTDAVGGRTIVVDGVAAAPILVKPTDFIDIGDEEFSALVGYQQYLAAFKEGGEEFQSALPLHTAFLKAAATKNEKLLSSALFRRSMGLDSEQAGQRPRRTKSSQQPVGAR
jgi:hypothetical protein